MSCAQLLSSVLLERCHVGPEDEAAGSNDVADGGHPLVPVIGYVFIEGKAWYLHHIIYVGKSDG